MRTYLPYRPAKKLKIFTFLVALIVLALAYSPARAQTTNKLIVAPARQELIVDPGEKVAINVKFLNQGETPISGTLRAVDFIVEDTKGTPSFIESTPTVIGIAQISPRFSAASWVSLPYDRATIAPKNKIQIQTKINVPTDARPGGRYVAIFFEVGGAIPEAHLSSTPEVASPVTQSIAALVYLRVSGPIKEDAYIVQLTAPRFSEYGPISLLTEISNRGDYHIKPIGSITLYNTFGQIVDRQPLDEQNIFPDISRIFENKIGQKWMFGKYKAELTASYGETGKALTALIFFWVLPWKIMAAVILAIIILILLANITYGRFHKREEKLEDKIEELEEKLKIKK